jgi:predicted nucleotidyltransferase
MKLEDIKLLINSEKYEFLHTNPHLGNKIVFLTLGGSYAYGTNVDTSDIDIRGCALNSRSDILGLSNFEQVVNTETDTTIYSFNKLIHLLLNCNPNIIELFGCRPEQYFIITDIGKELLDNRKMFLSQRAAKSFGGYATAQLRRLENAIARDALPQDKKEEHIRKSMESSLQQFKNNYEGFDEGSIRLYTGKSTRDDMDMEILVDVNLHRFPARQFNCIMNDMTSILGTYEHLNNRNRKKDAAHLNKHAMHLIRLYLMCLDILEKEEINTYRENERDFLLSIRNGAFQNNDGTYKKEFFDIVSEYEKRMEYAKKNTSLPAHPNMKIIEDFVISVNRRAIDESL